MSPQNPLWRALSRHKDVPANVRDQVGQVYGVDSRGRPNTRAAAEALGVSQRTVQRWIRADHAPANSHGQELQRRHTDWQTSPAARSSQIAAGRLNRLRSQGTTLRIAGTFQISSDKRARTLAIEMTGEQMSKILDAALQGDDRAAHQELEDALGDNYFGGNVAITHISDMDTYR